jgi:hypothetical protein
MKYNSNNQVKEEEMDRACSMHGKKEITCRVLVGNPERRPLGRCRCRLEDNIKVSL